MADEIVTRLVAFHGLPRCTDSVCVVCEAAEEIERLRSALDAEGNDANLLMLEIQRLRAAEGGRIVNLRMLNEANAESSRLRAAGDAIVGALRMGMFQTVELLCNEWEEVRRG
jgi:hypothetical protein